HPERGVRIPALTQPVDLMPTLLEAFSMRASSVHGHSLLPLVRGEKDEVRAYACSGHQVGDALEWSLRTPEWAFLLPVQPGAADPARGRQLYVKPDDRWEVNNLVQHYQEFADHLDASLRAFVSAFRLPGPLQMPVLRTIHDIASTTPENEP